MYLIRPPKVYRWLFKEALFRESADKKTVYLTFDDGPHPEATAHVLNILESHGVKATFFVLGKNVEKHPELFRELKEKGHGIGNHGMNHLNGWTTATDEYIEDVARGKQITGSGLFRPPYGRLTLSQYNRLAKTEKIVLWDVISGDFDLKTNDRTVMNNVLKNVRNGSIIVMHDSQKAMNSLVGSMNEIIVRLKKKGYAFEILKGSNQPQY